MVKLTETNPEDVEQIREWVAVDPWHKDDPLCQSPESMITGNGLLSFCVQDDEGPVCYVKLTQDGLLRVRISIQFGPESEVSRKRVSIGLAQRGVPAMKLYAKKFGYRSLVFESKNPELIAFSKRFGFEAVGNDQFVAEVEG